MNTLTNEECRERIDPRDHFRIYEGTLCAFSREGEGPCNSDSGGPLTSNGQLIGIVSFGKPCGRGVPDGYTRVSIFLKWIREVSGAVAV